MRVSGTQRRTGLGSIVAMLSVMLVSGCGSGRVVVPIRMDAVTLAHGDGGAALETPAETVQGIARLMMSDLKLPVPDEVTVYIYETRGSFEWGLIHDAHVSPRRAVELSEFAIGVGKRRQLLLNADGQGLTGREAVRLMAHELTHVAQIELARGEGRGEQWLAEGMAEWVAFQVLERWGLDTIDRRRYMAAAGIRDHAALVGARLDLETLGTPRGFTVRHLREGSLPTYQLAFLMADYLIAREGWRRVVEYFARFAAEPRRGENFRQAFGQTLEQFEHEVVTHLKTLVR